MLQDGSSLDFTVVSQCILDCASRHSVLMAPLYVLNLTCIFCVYIVPCWSSVYCWDQETISTCQFAQRVALIRNDAILNEELSPKLMIERLRREIQQLKDELAMSTGEVKSDALTEDEMTK